MKGVHQTHTFAGVDVSMPSKVRGSDAEEEWQEVDWVNCFSGDLNVGGDDYLLSFTPSEGNVKAKQLGRLLRASAVSQESEDRTVVVTTSDVLHRQLRFTFVCAKDANEFSKISELAEVANAASESRGIGETRSSSDAAALNGLETDIRAKMAGLLPLTFTGVELYGPDPSDSSGGTEVLLGRGVAVLLDPPENCTTVGTYSLAFYGEDEGVGKPLRQITIGPKTSLKRLKQEPAPDGGGPKRQRHEPELDGEGPAASFHLAAPLQGIARHTVAFDDAAVAAGFLRDFRVRQRVMDLSLKTVKYNSSADGLRADIRRMKNRSCGARLWRFTCLVVVLLLMAAAGRLAQLYQKDQGASEPKVYLDALAREVQGVARAAQAASVELGARACSALGSVPAADVRRCEQLVGGGGTQRHREVQACLQAVLGPR